MKLDSAVSTLLNRYSDELFAKVTKAKDYPFSVITMLEKKLNEKGISNCCREIYCKVHNCAISVERVKEKGHRGCPFSLDAPPDQNLPRRAKNFGHRNSCAACVRSDGAAIISAGVLFLVSCGKSLSNNRVREKRGVTVY